MNDQQRPDQSASDPEQPLPGGQESPEPAGVPEPASPAEPAEPAEPASPDADADASYAVPPAPQQPTIPWGSSQPPAPGATSVPQPPAPGTMPMPQQPAGAQQPPFPPAPVEPMQQPMPGAPQQPTQAYGQESVPGYQQQPGAGYAQPPAPGYGQPQPYYQPAQANSGKALGALICGILAIVFSVLPIVGVVLGIVAIVLASKAVKEAGKNGKTTAGKVCGVIGIVLAVIWFVVGMVAGFSEVYDALESSSTPSYSGAITDSSEGSSSSSSTLAEDEAELDALAVAQLDALKNKDAAVMQQLATDLDDGFSAGAGYSLDELGVDPAVFADWMLSDFSYELDGTYPFDDSGTVYADVSHRDVYAFALKFMDDAEAALDAGEMEGLDEAGALAKLGDIYKNAMDASAEMTTSYLSIDFVKQGDAWVLDEDDWNEEVDLMFGLY